MDKYEKEPVKAVAFYFLWGSIGAIILSIAVVYFFQFLFSWFINDIGLLDLTSKVIFAPVVEEMMKALFLLFTFRNKRFDNITDGLVYGGAIGLGFGMTENFFYFIGFGTTATAWIQLVIIRSIFSSVLHCITTATFGAFLGMAKFKTHNVKIFLIFSGYFLAVLMHASWNLLVQNTSTTLFGFAMMLLLIILFLLVFKYSTRQELKQIILELSEESELGYITVESFNSLGSGKIFKQLYKLKINEREYLRYLVKLAFRKSQLKMCSLKQKPFFEEEVNNYRNLIQQYNGR
jgi:RsiW-degrading membrane proteinase PrsW (M82 family)